MILVPESLSSTTHGKNAIVDGQISTKPIQGIILPDWSRNVNNKTGLLYYDLLVIGSA